jgi:competence ComEA-like helix-hairpin-helix protein
MRNAGFFLIFLLNICFASSACTSEQIDINSASIGELDKLEGIGPVYAQRIIDSRPFLDIGDLLNVKGIGNVTLSKIKVQGLACVSAEEEEEKEVEKEDERDTEEVEEQEEEKDDGIEANKPSRIREGVVDVLPENPAVPAENGPIKLSSVKEEVVYKSRTAYIGEYLIYGFCLLLIILILVLIWDF